MSTIESQNQTIPFNIPWLSGREMEYMGDCLRRGELCGGGYYGHLAQHFLEQRFSAKQVLLTTSCTSALEMAAMLANIGPGDEVILPSYTFVSTANAFVRAGAIPRFVDIRPDTLNMDERLVEQAITSKTKAIVPVHYAGIACQMDALMHTAKQHNLFVIEDAAQGVDSTYKGHYLGTLGDAGTFSFHETKNFVCGEGGALIVNRIDWQERAEIIREKGTNRSQFIKGQVDKYTWVDIGSSFLPSDILAAFLLGQLQAMEEINTRRKTIAKYYRQGLSDLEAAGFFQLPYEPTDCSTNNHMFYILTPDINTRDALLEHLHKANIKAVFHYIPLHSSPMGMKYGYSEGTLPVTEKVAATIIRLPLFPDLTEFQQDYIIKAIKDFF